MGRIQKRSITQLESKVQHLYLTTRIYYEERYYSTYLKKCYDNIKSIIRIQNYNRWVVILTNNLSVPNELIRIIQGYAKMYAPQKSLF